MIIKRQFNKEYLFRRISDKHFYLLFCSINRACGQAREYLVNVIFLNELAQKLSQSYPQGAISIVTQGNRDSSYIPKRSEFGELDNEINGAPGRCTGPKEPYNVRMLGFLEQLVLGEEVGQLRGTRILLQGLNGDGRLARPAIYVLGLGPQDASKLTFTQDLLDRQP
jgi:hypothetical protein